MARAMLTEADLQKTVDELRRELAARTAELAEARVEQTATADVLKLISRSAFDLQAVLDTLTESAARLGNADMGSIARRDERGYYHATAYRFAVDWVRVTDPLRLQPGRGSVVGRALLAKKAVQIIDVLEDPEYIYPDMQQAAGYRTLLGVPLMRQGDAIGVLFLGRRTVEAFTDRQIELVSTFADQAVIAIENARLFDEVQAKTRDLTEALTYQTGSANILNVIASSPTDVTPVLKAIVESACELCEAYDAAVVLRDGNDLRFSAHHGPIPIGLEKWPINRRWTAGRAFIDQKPVHIADLRDEIHEDFSDGRELSLRMGHRSILSVPLLREKESIGAIVLRRTEVHPFSDKQIALLQTFAAQAVIAIGNVHLFDEVQARTRDLQESLQQQTATAEVLKVISRSAFNLQTVFDTLAASATELCEANTGIIFLRDGDLFRAQATAGARPEFLEFLKARPRRRDDKSMVPRVARAGAVVHIPDVALDPDFQFQGHEDALGRPVRSILGVPLLRNGMVEGVFVVSRHEPKPFTQRQIELVEAFSDQAVIAIENVRLFDEVQARTRDLQESLQQQTATADVLKVISRSAFDLQTVLDTLVVSATRLCEADEGTIFQPRDGAYRLAAICGVSPKRREFFENYSFRPGEETTTGRVLLKGTTIHIEDSQTDPNYRLSDPEPVRTRLGVPLLREGAPIGVFVLARRQTRPFSDKQIELVQTFADQAVIAIENVRLFDEVQARTRELTQSLHDLRTAQDRLIQTEKLASLGQLTAGIAHEIKNPLNFVNNFSALSVELIDELNDLLKQTVLSGKIRAEVDELTGLLKDNLGKVVQHGKRADSIVRNMLLHSREGSGEHRPADINALVDESLNLAYHGARAEKPHFNVTLQRNFDPEAGMIEAFPQEITRVFLNLISNGFYAVSKRKADCGAEYFEPVITATTKGRTDHVEICIRDNGTGIPPDVKEKMFNPFFTTKPAGEGTGLGLSMSYDIIVKQHGGTIDVDTLQGEFTEFTIVLPRTSNFSNKSRG